VDVAVASRFFALLTLVADLAVVGAIVLVVAARVSTRAAVVKEDVRDFLSEYGLVLAWVVAATATLGSLYYSEVAGFVPCKLCWYQRIAMYPLVIVLGVATLRRDLPVRRYVLPVVGIGGAISIYHYLLQRFPDISGASCDPTAPCTVTWVWQFHYISIPFMALSGFALIAVLLLGARAAVPDISSTSDEREERSPSEHTHGGALGSAPA